MFSFSNTPPFQTPLLKMVPCLVSIALIAFSMVCRKTYVVRLWIFAEQRNGALVLMTLRLGNRISKPLRLLSSSIQKQTIYNSERITRDEIVNRLLLNNLSED